MRSDGERAPAPAVSSQTVAMPKRLSNGERCSSSAWILSSSANRQWRDHQPSRTATSLSSITYPAWAACRRATSQAQGIHSSASRRAEPTAPAAMPVRANVGHQQSLPMPVGAAGASRRPAATRHHAGCGAQVVAGVGRRQAPARATISPAGWDRPATRRVDLQRAAAEQAMQHGFAQRPRLDAPARHGAHTRVSDPRSTVSAGRARSGGSRGSARASAIEPRATPRPRPQKPAAIARSRSSAVELADIPERIAPGSMKTPAMRFPGTPARAARRTATTTMRGWRSGPPARSRRRAAPAGRPLRPRRTRGGCRDCPRWRIRRSSASASGQQAPSSRPRACCRRPIPAHFGRRTCDATASGSAPRYGCARTGSPQFALQRPLLTIRLSPSMR